MDNDDDNQSTVHAPWGKTSTEGISPGGAGSGAGGSTDTGGLDASGNELGASTPNSEQGMSEKDRRNQAITNADSH